VLLVVVLLAGGDNRAALDNTSTATIDPTLNRKQEISIVVDQPRIAQPAEIERARPRPQPAPEATTEDQVWLTDGSAGFFFY
jgi:hypothetical protein